MNGTTGKSIAGLGFLVRSACIFIWYLCIGFMNMRGMELRNILNIVNIAQIAGTVLVIGGFGILFLSERDILDLAVAGLTVLSVALSFFVQNQSTMISIIGILYFVPMIIEALRSSKTVIAAALAVAFVLAFAGNMIVSKVFFQVFGLPFLGFVAYGVVQAVALLIPAAYSFTREV